MGIQGTSDSSEKELAAKLLSTLHLNVEEREHLPGGRVRFSVALAVVADRLSETGWFSAKPGSIGISGDGAFIEQRDNKFCLHERFENGVGSFSPVETNQFRSLRKALRRYIKHYGGYQIDGVAIDRWA